MSLHVFPLTLAQANDLVGSLHRHHKPVVGHRFSLGCRDKYGNVHGAVIVGRPVARRTEQYEIAEVTRLVTDGTKNACSILYSAAARVCRTMGFFKIQTFILDSESGTSLKASGWKFVSTCSGGDWNCQTRGGRRTDQPQNPKQKWELNFATEGLEDLL